MIFNTLNSSPLNCSRKRSAQIYRNVCNLQCTNTIYTNQNGFSLKLINFCLSISIKLDVCVCVSKNNSGTLERFQPNLVHILCVRILCMFYMYSAGGWCGRQGIWMIHIVEEIKLLLLLGNRLKHIRGNVRYLVTWNVKEFTVGYSTE
jgi:hypothetical protein